MIIKIEINNVNAIGESVITFNKGKYQYKNDMILKNEIVNPMAFYGTNGSGKSSFLKAVSQVVSLLIDEPDKLKPLTPHLSTIQKDKSLILEPSPKSSVKIDYKLNNKVYEYELETSIKGYISLEKLNVDGKIIFKRNRTSYTYYENKFNVKSEMFPVLRTLYIESNDDSVKNSYEFLSNIGYIDASKKLHQIKVFKQKSYLDIIVEKSKEIKNILEKYHEFPIYDVTSQINDVGEKEYFVVIKEKDNISFLPWGFISTGMENQSVLLAAVLTLPNNGVLIIDEIEDALHPLTLLDFIRAVQEKNIQLIFSSHNTYLLQSMRPDQIYFANWKNGYSKYKKLADIYPNIREVNNIEKMYLANLFEEDIKKDE